MVGSTMKLGIVIGSTYKGKGMHEANNALGELKRTTNTLQPKLQRINKTIMVLGKNAKVMGNSLGKSFSRLDNIGTRKIGMLGATLTGASVGMGLLNKETAKMQNLANAVGLSHSVVSGYGNSIRDIGLDYENVIDIKEELDNKIGESKSLYDAWAKGDRSKPLKLVGGVEDAFKGLKFGLSNKNFKGLNSEETFKRFIGLDGDKQLELVIDTALKMKDTQKAKAMVDILMGSEANKMIGYWRKQNLSQKEILAQQKEMSFLNEEGLKGAMNYNIAIGKTSTILGSMSRQFSGIGGEFATPYIKSANAYLVANKALIQGNIKGFFTGIGEAVDDVSDSFDRVEKFIKPVIGLLGSTEQSVDKLGSTGSTVGKTLVYSLSGLVALKGLKVFSSVGIKGLKTTSKLIGTLGTVSRGTGSVLGGLAHTLGDMERKSKRPIKYKLRVSMPKSSLLMGNMKNLIRTLSSFARANPIVLGATVASYGGYQLYKETLKKDVMGTSEKRLEVFKRERENNTPLALARIDPKQAKFEKNKINQRRVNLDKGRPTSLKESIFKNQTRPLEVEDIERKISFLKDVAPQNKVVHKKENITVNVTSNITVNSNEVDVKILENKITRAVQSATRKARSENNNVSHLDEEI